MEAGTLIGYFAERDEARRARRELQRRGFRRAAWVHKNADGDVHIWDPFLWRRALGATLTAILFGGLADRKSTRLNSSHGYISYAVFCLIKKNICLVVFLIVLDNLIGIFDRIYFSLL